MSDIFISYKREDAALVKDLADKLSELGWSIWWDQDIPAGRDYDTVIEEELESSKCVVVLWSKHSVASRNVKAEANEALEKNKYIPIVIGDTKPPLLFRYVQGVICNDSNEVTENKFNELVKHIKRLLGEPPVTPSKSEHEIVKSNEAHTDEKVSEKKLIAKKQEIEFDSVQIGNQIWMKRNLDVDRFQNGDPIPEAKSVNEWSIAGKNKQPAWCYYDNDTENGRIYGKLYNWYAVNDPRGLAPEGWHVPSDEEWTTLTDYLGGEDSAGGKMKSTGTQYWKSPNAEATNESGLSGLPGGFRTYDEGFLNIGFDGNWWSYSELNTDPAWLRGLSYDDGKVYRSFLTKEDGFSVRCLRD